MLVAWVGYGNYKCGGEATEGGVPQTQGMDGRGLEVSLDIGLRQVFVKRVLYM